MINLGKFAKKSKSNYVKIFELNKFGKILKNNCVKIVDQWRFIEKPSKKRAKVIN